MNNGLRHIGITEETAMALFQNTLPADSINEAIALLSVLSESLDEDYPRYLLLKTVIDGLTQTADKLSAA